MAENGEVTRRDALKLAAGAAALGASLGLPRAALAMSATGEPAYEFYFKFYNNARLMQSIPLTDELAEAMVSTPGAINFKFWRSPSEVVGSVAMPQEIALKFKALGADIKRTR